MWWDGRGTHCSLPPHWQVHTEESAALFQRRGRLKECSDSMRWHGALARVCRVSEIQALPLVAGQIAPQANYDENLKIILKIVLKNSCHSPADLLMTAAVPPVFTSAQQLQVHNL